MIVYFLVVKFDFCKWFLAVFFFFSTCIVYFDCKCILVVIYRIGEINTQPSPKLIHVKIAQSDKGQANQNFEL